MPLLITGRRSTSDVERTAQALADALNNGDRAAFQAVVCQNISPRPTWPDQLDQLHPIHVSVTNVEDLGESSMVVPSATLVVDNTGIRFSVAINKYDTRISDHPCVFVLDQVKPH